MERIPFPTDTRLDFFEAYRIYSMRWAIEVCFSEMKEVKLRLEMPMQELLFTNSKHKPDTDAIQHPFPHQEV